MRAATPRTIPLSEFGLMTVRQVVAHLRVSRGRVGQWIQDGRLAAVPVSRGFLVRRPDCERFVKPPRGRPLSAKNQPKRVATTSTVRRAAPVLIPLSEFGLLTVAEVAEYHAREIHTVWCWVARGLLPAVPLDRGVLIPRADCEHFETPKIGGGSGPRARVAPAGMMTTADVARHHGVTGHAVLTWIGRGRLRAVATPGGYLVRRADCEAFQKPKPGRPLGRKTSTGKRRKV